MNEKLKEKLASARDAFVGFARAKGVYLAALVGLLALSLALAFTLLPAEDEEGAAGEEASLSGDERLGASRTAAPSPSPAQPAPAASPSPTPTLIPDFTEAPPKTPAPSETLTLSPPVQGEVLRGFAMDELIYSRTLDQWMTHGGVDVAAPKGSEVYSVFSGTVERVYEDDALGVTVEVSGRGDMLALYANLAPEPPVSAGDRLLAGDLIGVVGDTAVSECAEKSHLHFELHSNGHPIDPQSMILFIK